MSAEHPPFLATGKLDAIFANLPDCLSQSTTAMAYQFAETADQSTRVNNSPVTVAAASVYLAAMVSNDHLTQAVVAEAAGCSESSIRANWPLVADVNGMPHTRQEPYRRDGNSSDSQEDQASNYLSRFVAFLRGESA